MKLNESFVKRLMTLAGNADYSSRFITEAKKKTTKKGGYGKRHSKKKEEEELMEAEGEDDERELLSDEDEFEMEDDEGEESEEDEDLEYEGMEDEDEDSLSGVEDEFDVDSVGDELEDEDEEFGGEKGGTEVTVDAKELVAAVTNALASVLGSNVVSMESANDNEMDMESDDEMDMDMESDDEMDMEETPRPVGESRRVTNNISRAIAESVFNKLVARGIFEAKDEKKKNKPAKKQKVENMLDGLGEEDLTPEVIAFLDKLHDIRMNRLASEKKMKADRLQKGIMTIDDLEELFGRSGIRKKGYTINRESNKYEKKDTSSTKRAASNKKPVEDSYQMKKIKGMPGDNDED